MGETSKIPDPHRQEGWAKACEGIVRAEFGRRSCVALNRALSQIETDLGMANLGRTQSVPTPEEHCRGSGSGGLGRRGAGFGWGGVRRSVWQRVLL